MSANTPFVPGDGFQAVTAGTLLEKNDQRLTEDGRLQSISLADVGKPVREGERIVRLRRTTPSMY